MKAKYAFLCHVVTDQAENIDYIFNYGISGTVKILYITRKRTSKICAFKVTVINTSNCYMWLLQNCKTKPNISKTR